jgi:hypothetical protein
MTEHSADQDKPISDSLHPLVHVAIIGLVLGDRCLLTKYQGGDHAYLSSF